MYTLDLLSHGGVTVLPRSATHDNSIVHVVSKPIRLKLGNYLRAAELSAKMRRCAGIGLMLDSHCRRRSKIISTLGQRFVFVVSNF